MFSSIVKVITGWVRLRGATDDTFIGNVSDSVKVHVTNGGSGGTAQADKSTFTEGTTTFTPVGGVFNDTISSDPTEDQAAAARITAKRAVHTNLRNNSGTEIATSSNPLRIDPTGTTTQPISAASLPLPTGAATETTLSSINGKLVNGNDIGDVTVNNAAGASAVNIQDGGNSITVDQATAANLQATARINDGNGVSITVGTKDQSSSLPITESETATFSAYITDVAIAQNKSMISILNAGGSAVKIKIREIRVINVRTTATTGVVAEFQLLRITAHSSGTTITPISHDSTDTLNGSVTVRSAGTVTETAGALRRWLWSSDEWGTGATDVESFDHAFQNSLPQYKTGIKEKPFTLNAGQGLHLKEITNSTNGTFDLLIVFTQE